MPVSVNAVLRESLAGSVEPGHQHHHSHPLLQTQIASAAKHLVLKKIEYEDYPENFLSQNDALKSKYILLSATTNVDKTASGVSFTSKKTLATSSNRTDGLDGANAPVICASKKDINNKDELPLPKRTLFPRDKIKVGWKGGDRKWQIGSGFINVGNTCYLNSTLQALFHVPALANWLASDTEHREECCSNAEMCCTICAVANTLRLSQQAGHAVKPYTVYSRLRSICRHMVVGRQEDAHEFLRYLIESMEKAFLERFSKTVLTNLDQYSKETTPLNQILGFYLRSSVRCLSCNHVSITFQHFEDLLLDIRKANTVDEALQGYFGREKLDDMDYTCSNCKKKVTATKQFSIERPPIVLCIQLKRFSMQGNKLNKHVSIKAKLDLTPYVRRTGGTQHQPLTYRLVSMVTHLGSSQHCGHYTAIGLTESGAYYQFDDSSVHPIALQNVLQTNAYIIFYELESTGMVRTVNGSSTLPLSTITMKAAITSELSRPVTNVVSTTNGTESRGFIGPVLPPNHLLAHSKINGNANTSSSSPLKRESPMGNGIGAKTMKTSHEIDATTEKVYRNASELFEGTQKQSNEELVLADKSEFCEVEKAKEHAQNVTKSLVPYASYMTSDEEDTDDDDDKKTQKNGEVQEKNLEKIGSPAQNGQFTPYVNSNSGIWKVSSSENGKWPKKESPWKANGNGGRHQNNGAKVLNELLKNGSKGYGGVGISTWSGEKSNLDKEVLAEKNSKRPSDRQADDEEMDMGHVRKVKINNNIGRDNPGFNPFQELENNMNQAVLNGNCNYRPYMPMNRPNHKNHGYGQARSWVNNDRLSGTGGASKPYHHQKKIRIHNHQKWRHNKKHAMNRFKGNNYQRSGSHHHNGNRPNN